MNLIDAPIEAGFASVNGIDIAYERLGDAAAPPVLMIMGLGGQLVSWPASLCQQLLVAGYQVVRFDNRDAGLSSKFDHHGRPPVLRVAADAGPAPVGRDAT